jgi:hypothetical protein
MLELCSRLSLNSSPPFCLAVFMEQLTTLGVEPGDKELATRYLASLKSELTEEKTAWEKAEAEVGTLT